MLCTVRLARRVLTRDEAPSVRLSALARLFGAATTPTHRALDDARATVDVLHALIERVGNQGVHTYADLRVVSARRDTGAAPQARTSPRACRTGPGVYLFRGPADEVLYVGTAVDLRRRVGQYFNGADPRTRMKEMVALASRGRPRRVRARRWRPACANCGCWPRTPRRTTAGRSSRSGGGGWCSPTRRFRASRWFGRPGTTAPIGPFRARADAVETAALLARFTGVRTCTTRLARSALHGPACPERRAVAVPGAAATSPPPSTPTRRSRATALIDGLEDNALLGGARPRSRELAARDRYETAARLRDHAAAAIDALWRGQRLRALAAVAELVAAAPGRRGRLAPRGDPARPARRGGHRAPRRAADAGRRRDQRWGTSDSARAAPRWAARWSRRPR